MIVDEGPLSRRPARSLFRYAKLRRLFPGDLDKLTNSGIARLCVLFEDLRIEIAGLSLPRPSLKDERGLAAGFDVAGHELRSFYFLRRSIATCVEFAEAIRLLDQASDFKKLVARFPAEGQTTWRESLNYFGRKEKFWKEIRNDVGGHFGSKASEFAVESFLPDAGGSIEVHLNHDGKGGAILGFASEIAATALLRRLPGGTHKEKSKNLIDEVMTAFPHAIRAVECIVNDHMWDRAG